MNSGRSSSSSGSRALRVDWLDLQSKVLKRWKRRWTELDDEKLSFFEPPESQSSASSGASSGRASGGGETNRSGSIGQSHGPLDTSILFSDVANVTGPDTDEFVLTLHLRSSPLLPVKVKCFTRERAMDWRADIQYRCGKKDK